MYFFIKDDQMPTTRTMAVIDMKSRHSSRDLKILMKVLADYKIDLDHVLVCVTDNASNMVRFVSDLNEEQILIINHQYHLQLQAFN